MSVIIIISRDKLGLIYRRRKHKRTRHVMPSFTFLVYLYNVQFSSPCDGGGGGERRGAQELEGSLDLGSKKIKPSVYTDYDKLESTA